MPRTALAAATTFYVSTTGNNANDGLTALTAWETLQGAWQNMQGGYDFAGNVVTVQLANGIYRGGLNATGPILGLSGAGSLIFKGDMTNNNNVIVSPWLGNPFAAAYGAMYSIHGIAMDSAGVAPTPHNPNGGADLISVGQFSAVRIKQVTFHNGVGNGHMAVAFGGNITIDQPGYTIIGGGQYHITAGAGGTIYYDTDGITGLITIQNSHMPTFTAGFACANGCAVINAQGLSFTGGAYGPTYLAKNNGIIDTRNGNPNYFPGMIAGTVASGGQYN